MEYKHRLLPGTFYSLLFPWRSVLRQPWPQLDNNQNGLPITKTFTIHICLLMLLQFYHQPEPD